MEKRIRTSELLGEMVALFRANGVVAFPTIIVLAAVATLFDYLNPNGLSNLPYTIASFIASVILTKRALDELGLRGRTSTAGAAYFGLSFVSNLAVLIGLVLLIVPGIILAARWSASGAILFAEEIRMTDSMRKSWQMTEGNVAAIVIAQLALILILAIPVVGVGVASTFSEAVNPPVTLLAVQNLAVSGWQTLAIYFGVAVYRLLRTEAEELNAIFA